MRNIPADIDDDDDDDGDDEADEDDDDEDDDDELESMLQNAGCLDCVSNAMALRRKKFMTNDWTSI
jgi:hypothetical protein